MISRRTKLQLVVFVLITMVGVAYVGARYARLDRLFVDNSYRVTAHFKQSGGIFAGAEVSYRGVGVGKVSRLKVTHRGVDVILDIDNDTEPVPSNTRAVVANRSAVGEQYVDLQPQRDDGPYLGNDSQIPRSRTETPIKTTQLLVDLDQLVNSVNKKSLRTVVSELGRAFNGTGRDLGRIIDTSNAFIKSANDNFDVTTALLQDGNRVLRTQIQSDRSIRSFSHDLALFSDTLVASDQDLRTVIENGSATANQLRRFLQRNRVDLAALINNLVTTGQIVVKHLDGIEQVLVLYPYVVAGGFTVVGKSKQTGLYDAHFGLILTQNPPVCHQGYGGTHKRAPQDRAEVPMNVQAHCAEPPSQSNARGAQNAPRPGAAPRPPVVAAYDQSTGKLRYTDQNPSGSVSYTGGAASAFGQDSWKWLLLQPLADAKE